MSNRTTRRTFVKSVAAAGLTMPLLMPRLVRAESANGKLTVAFVGTGGRAEAHVGEMAGMKIPAACYCDVDTGRQGNAAKNWPNATAYQDYRIMFDKQHKDFDAVFVAVPDHHHFPAAMLGLLHDKAVYCEKPLTWSMWEAQMLTKEAAKRKLPTQMGNQGHAGGGWRTVVAWIQEGAIGDVKEVHSWTNRPIWPQGKDRPAGEDPVPATLAWDTWLGAAPERPYKNGVYNPFVWRGWLDFGAGALGDMACHTMDGVFWALDPGHPDSIELINIEGAKPEMFPNKSVIRWKFPAKGARQAFDCYWYDGTPDLHNKPKRPDSIKQEEWDKINSGNLFIGTKGILRVWGDYGDSPRLVSFDAAKPDALLEEVGKPKNPIEPSPGHHKEFVMAAKGEKPYDFPKSNFSYAGPMTATILMGTIAQHLNMPGEVLKFDGAANKFTNNDKATDLMYREPRKGWKVYDQKA
jgi:predicted dehydrogenase